MIIFEAAALSAEIVTVPSPAVTPAEIVITPATFVAVMDPAAVISTFVKSAKFVILIVELSPVYSSSESLSVWININAFTVILITFDIAALSAEIVIVPSPAVAPAKIVTTPATFVAVIAPVDVTSGFVKSAKFVILIVELFPT
ncbi:hypothetical protein [Spiroplasma sp. TIUS-1]|uniref:hypothetical protein n=1 Tax=Spiroplasma sp. TIUS-1 TaxID=216963 RepID=UPI0013A68D8F|nr:hypothetical protein [Spiroplasma sp. TIUS-1]